MKAIELSKAFDPKSYEDRIYKEWLEKGYFAPAATPRGRAATSRFVVVIPPPNVTGVLHMGHGLNNCLQDIEVRYHRMLGDDTLWVPGTDHAGIATQHVVEKALKKRGTSRQEIGREKFVEETWKVTQEHHDIIVKQLQKLGSSCDWEPRALHARRGPLPRRARGLRLPVRERPDLPGQLPGELVPLLPHGHLRRRGGARGSPGQDVPLPAIPWRTARAPSPSPPRAPRPCWATPRWR